MREVKFRGQHLISKEWLTGNLFIDSDGRAYISQAHHIESLSHAEFSRSFIEVDPNTVGEFTGLLDKNGNEIYEGDKLLLQGNCTAVVVWRNEGFIILDTCSYVQTNRGEVEGFVYVPVKKTMEIIGNIHDNPEFLKR